MVKLEGSDIWGCVNVPTAEEKAAAAEKHSQILQAVQEEILSNISNIKIVIECEDGKYPGTFRDLQFAVETARTEELEGFLSAGNKRLFFEDGYISVKF